jgi:SAM-dependent methyltransferase
MPLPGRDLPDLFAMLTPEYNESLYQDYDDLRSFSSEQLSRHWQNHGLKEGRRASTVRDRESFSRLIAELPIRSALEIGCFDKPSLEQLRNTEVVVHYADYLAEAELKQRAQHLPGRDPAMVPPIEYVLSDGYDQIKRKYDLVTSNHCIEHQPDLLSHLLWVANILSPKGLYIASIPDRRKCFDHFLPSSSVIDVLAAFYEKRTKPSFKSVLEHRCFIVDDYGNAEDPLWNFEVGRASRQGFDRAFQEFVSSPYVDVHTFQFTAFTFKNLMKQLAAYAFLPQTTQIMVYNGINEFYIALQF